MEGPRRSQRREHDAQLDARDKPGLGVPCAEAQADGVPCDVIGADCETCERALLAHWQAAAWDEPMVASPHMYGAD